MKILLCHNFYQRAGGEDVVFQNEGRLLESHGHEVIRYTRHNDHINEMNSLGLPNQVIWSRQTVRQIEALILKHRPDIIHCTNIFPLISPSVYYVASRHGVKVVQSIHNYRFACINGMFLRNQKICEKCLGKSVPLAGLLHKCYRDSYMASAVATASYVFHQALKTSETKVDRFITLTEFGKQKLIEARIPEGKISIKPNFLYPEIEAGDGSGDYSIFVGRLCKEKGLFTLIEAWKKIQINAPLYIVGDGELIDLVRKASVDNPQIRVLGNKSRDEVLKLIGAAKMLIIPSIWYEGLPMTIVEAFAMGTPVIGSKIGAMEEILSERSAGELFEAGNAEALAKKVRLLLGEDAETSNRRRQMARETYELKYSTEANYQTLIAIYRKTLNASI